ncbi:uncharacterized protein METZ01_LOCUS437873, partial [marine metagenome]
QRVDLLCQQLPIIPTVSNAIRKHALLVEGSITHRNYLQPRATVNALFPAPADHPKAGDSDAQFPHTVLLPVHPRRKCRVTFGPRPRTAISINVALLPTTLELSPSGHSNRSYQHSRPPNSPFLRPAASFFWRSAPCSLHHLLRRFYSRSLLRKRFRMEGI